MRFFISCGIFLAVFVFHLDADKSSFGREMVIFSGNANKELAKEVADYLHIPLGDCIVSKFNDGEVQIIVNDNIRNKDVFIIQSNCLTLSQSVNDNLMEMYLLVRTMKRASAAHITAVIPYYGYARQDRKNSGRVPISAADIALMLEMAGVDRVVTIDLHCGQIQGFFRDIPVDNLYSAFTFIPYLSTKKLNNVVVVSPDVGGVERAKKFMDYLVKQGVSSEMAMISKQREKAGVIASMHLIGDVKDADAIIIDDICDTGGTLIKAAKLLKDQGARRVFAVVTHAVFSKNALEMIETSDIDEMMVSNTIPLRGDVPHNLKCISVGPLLAQAIERIQSGESLSNLFE